MRKSAVLLLASLIGCGGTEGGSQTGERQRQPRRFEPPVASNAESPIAYPAELFTQKIEGTVLLHIYVDATGAIVPESTRIAESSGHAQLDSAALTGAPGIEYTPAMRDGAPVAAAFLQPVHFRHPETTSAESQ